MIEAGFGCFDSVGLMLSNLVLVNIEWTLLAVGFPEVRISASGFRNRRVEDELTSSVDRLHKYDIYQGTGM